MNAEFLQDVIGEMDDVYILDAYAETAKTAERKTTRRKIAVWISLAACFCLIAAGGFFVLDRLDYLAAQCGASPGIVADGVYYYSIPHDGVYRYTPEGESEKLISKFWYDTWSANNYGVYYTRGRSLYVRPHETGKAQKLFTASLADSTHIHFTLFNDGNVALTIYNKHTEVKYELLLDGTNGGVLATLMEPTSYSEQEILYSQAVFTAGDRTLRLVGSDIDATADLQENGVSLLPDGIEAYKYPLIFGDNLMFDIYDASDPDVNRILVVRGDGSDALLSLDSYEYIQGGTADGGYLFFTRDNDVRGIDTFTGETWALSADADHDFCDLSTDGEYLYTCAPWNDIQTCWKIVYDEQGKPTALQLVAENIIEK